MTRPLLALLQLSACSMDKHIIEEGDHSSTTRVVAVKGSWMVSEAIFNASAVI